MASDLTVALIAGGGVLGGAALGGLAQPWVSRRQCDHLQDERRRKDKQDIYRQYLQFMFGLPLWLEQASRATWPTDQELTNDFKRRNDALRADLALFAPLEIRRCADTARQAVIDGFDEKAPAGTDVFAHYRRQFEDRVMPSIRALADAMARDIDAR